MQPLEAALAWIRESIWLGLPLASGLGLWWSLMSIGPHSSLAWEVGLGATLAAGLGLGLGLAALERAVWAVRGWVPGAVAPLLFAGAGALLGHFVATLLWAFLDPQWAIPEGACGFQAGIILGEQTNTHLTLLDGLRGAALLALPTHAVLRTVSGQHVTAGQTRWFTAAAVVGGAIGALALRFVAMVLSLAFFVL